MVTYSSIIYIYLGRAFTSLGRKDAAVMVWELGYERAVNHSTDLKQLLELEELLKCAKQEIISAREKSGIESVSSELLSQSGPRTNDNSSETNKSCNGLRLSKSCGSSEDTSEVCSEHLDKVVVYGSIGKKAKGKEEFNSQKIGKHNTRYTSIPNAESRDEPCNRSSESSSSSESSNLSQISSTPSIRIVTSRREISDESNKNKKFCVTRISKAKSISLDLRLSRGIAEVNDGKYARAISIFDQLLKEDPNYPEALIGRGTAYAFQRELEPAIVDFTKAIQSNPSACEAWKRRGQARAALGKFIEVRCIKSV